MEEETMTDEQLIMSLADKMKDQVPGTDERSNTHTFLQRVAEAEDNLKTGFLRVDNNIDELGIPRFHTRGLLEMKKISSLIMGNHLFSKYFSNEIQDVMASSLSREGFLIKQATTQTKQVADATLRRKVNKGMFGKKKVEETGGDLFSPRVS